MLPIDTNAFTGRSKALVTFTALLAFTFCLPSSGQTANLTDSRPLWQAVIEENAAEVEYKGSVLSKQDDSVWIVLARRPALSMAGSQTLALRVLNHSGETVFESSVADLIHAARLPSIVDQFVDIAPMDNGDVAILYLSGTQFAILVVNGNTHSVSRIGKVRLASVNVHLTKMLSTSEGGLLLIGSTGTRALAIKLDQALSIVWEKAAEPLASSAYFDGAVLKDNSVVLVGLHPDPDSSARSSLWIGRLSASGETTKSIVEPGRFGSIAAGPGDGCSMVQGIPAARGVDFWFRSYDKDLNQSWSTNLILGAQDYQPFRLSAISLQPADYLVVGSEKRSLWLARVRTGSSVLSLSPAADYPSGTFPNLVWNFGVMSDSGKMTVVPATLMVVNSHMQQRETVKIVALELQ